jgi:hypothetical protein
MIIGILRKPDRGQLVSVAGRPTRWPVRRPRQPPDTLAAYPWPRKLVDETLEDAGNAARVPHRLLVLRYWYRETVRRRWIFTFSILG